LAPLKVRDFLLLFSGQMVSTVGDSFYAVALPWLVLSSGGSPQELGIILSGYGIPRVGSVLLGGVLSDKLRPRRVMILADTVRAALVGILAALAFGGHPAFWQLLVVAVPLGAFEGIFLPATFSMLPEVLEDADLQAGNALNASSTQLALLLGSAVAGVVVGSLRSGPALGLDALTFVVSAVTLLLIRGRLRTRPHIAQIEPDGMKSGAEPLGAAATPEEGQAVEQQMTFWQLARTSRVLQVAFVVSTFANLAFGGLLEVALPTFVHTTLAAGATGYGLILAGFGGGALIGGLVAGTLGNVRHRGALALAVSLVQALAIALLPYGGLAGAIACMTISGIANAITNVIFMTIIQQIIPRHLLGRVMGLLMFASFGSYPLSVAVVGVIVARIGPVVMFPISGAFLAVAIVFGLLQRELREL
jgi:MFS family permease